MQKFLLTLAVFALAVSFGCQKPETAPDETKVKRYPIKGKVVSVDREKKRAKVEHEEIPGFMEAMTMDFPIHEDWVWEDLKPTVEIQAELVVDSSRKDPYWLEKIAIVALPGAGQEIPAAAKPSQIGKTIPDFTLTNQDGKKIKASDYRGKALAITFIYRECPLPEYCIKMSQHFSDMANRIAADAQAKQNTRLLSISFDPDRDTPEKLKTYGLGYLGKDPKDDFTVWQLAVGTDAEVRTIADFFGLKYEVDQNDKAQINHSLVTAVISADGKVTQVFNGGRWTPDEVMNELRLAGKSSQ